MNERDMENRIESHFSKCTVAVVDVTGMQNNFEIRLSTPDLANCSRVERHQKVMALFKEELSSGEIHALTIKHIK